MADTQCVVYVRGANRKHKSRALITANAFVEYEIKAYLNGRNCHNAILERL